MTVTGLRPGIFYNVRVIAVGSNNFHSSSDVLRLQTYDQNGRPHLASSRVIANISAQEIQNAALPDSSEEGARVRSHAASLEAAPVQEAAPAMAREHSGGLLGQRRNTGGGRRHSPSLPPERPAESLSRKGDEPEDMRELTDRLEAIQKEAEEVTSQFAKDAEDYKQQMANLVKERDEKKQVYKEKKEASDRLAKEANDSERANRQAQHLKSQKETAVRNKQAQKSKMRDDMSRWAQETEEMRKEKESMEEEKRRLIRARDQRLEDLRVEREQKQRALAVQEEEIRVLGLEIKELDEERKRWPGGEDDEVSRERDAAARREDQQWVATEQEWKARIANHTTLIKQTEIELGKAQRDLENAQPVPNAMMYNGNSSTSGLDIEGSAQLKVRKGRQQKSRTNTLQSSPSPAFAAPESPFNPVSAYTTADSPFSNAGPSYTTAESAFSNTVPVFPTTAEAAFATGTVYTAPTGAYFDLPTNDTGMFHVSEQNGMSEADVRALTNGAPLSPTASSLLPSNIFADDDPPPRSLGPSALPAGSMDPYNMELPQSRGSSSPSASRISSPHASAYNVSMTPGERGPGTDENRPDTPSDEAIARAKKALSASTQRNEQYASSSRIVDLFSRSNKRAPQEDDGLPLGSLKQGQSQSFPRPGDEPEGSARNRRMSFSNWPAVFGRSATASELPEGNGPAPARNTRRRAINMFSPNTSDHSAGYPDRDPSSPRPASVASSDLPRPSSDSGPFGWPPTEHSAARHSPVNSNWAPTMPNPWGSRSTSRRPSIHHGGSSSAAVSTGIATEDDDFLPPERNNYQSPPAVGIIGTKPASSQQAQTVTPKLNPAAPAFKLFSRSSKTDKGKGKAKSSSEESDRTAVGKVPLVEVSESSPRKSRDALSIRTDDSIAESHDSLDHSVSNTPSDAAGSSALSIRDGKEGSLRKLIRKTSSSGFPNLSSLRRSREPVSSLFKKTNGSERNASGDRSSAAGDLDEGIEADAGQLSRSADSVTSSPKLGSSIKDGKTNGRNWLGFKKGKKEEKDGRESRESMDNGERSRASETEGTCTEEAEDEEASNA